jgi:serine/threonine protein kinase
MQSDNKTYPIFNDTYEIIDHLGEGKTSKVYLCREIANPSKKVALKLIRNEFISSDPSAISNIESEIQILHGLNHNNVNKIIGYGSNGVCKKPSGRVITQLIYIILEYVPNGLFFDLVQTSGGLGETGGRYFMQQLVDVVKYMQSKNVVHRDLKLENIMVDEKLNLVLGDFGFATYRNVNFLKSYRGTKTYMAPEIKNGQFYDGKKSDIFSLGVILFILVQCLFPFAEAKDDDYYYKLIRSGQLEKYWQKTNGTNLSPEFKDLVLSMLSHDPSKRPTIEQVIQHPWMQKPFSFPEARSAIIKQLKINEYEHIIEEDDEKMVVDETSIGDKSTIDYDSDSYKTPRAQEIKESGIP